MYILFNYNKRKMNNLELTPNFDKYSTIIKYYKNNELDCLSTKIEPFRFYIVYIYSKKKLNLHSSFYKELDKNTNLLYRKERWWGEWSDPDIDSYDSYSINRIYFDILFNDKVANDISVLLNEKQQSVTHYNFEELEQKFNVIDFLQINLNYDNIK